MRLRITLALISIIMFAASLCKAQSNPHKQKLEWGKNVQGVQLYLTATNTVTVVGSTINVIVVLTNASTNPISIVFERYSEGTTDFDFTITSDDGKLYDFTPPSPTLGSSMNVTIKPTETDSRTIPVTFRKEIKPGNYKVKASRMFGTAKREEFKVESNLLQVQVK